MQECIAVNNIKKLSQIETGSRRTQNMTGSSTRHIPALDAIYDKCNLIKLNFTVFPTEQMCIS